MAPVAIMTTLPKPKPRSMSMAPVVTMTMLPKLKQRNMFTAPVVTMTTLMMDIIMLRVKVAAEAAKLSLSRLMPVPEIW